MFDGYEDAYPYGAGYEADGYANPLVSTNSPHSRSARLMHQY
jgi:hypothetical protein